jgi:hypothetical protein
MEVEVNNPRKPITTRFGLLQLLFLEFNVDNMLTIVIK